MALERIFYATHGVTLNGTPLKGVQSVGFTSNSNIEPVFQLGQLQHIEAVPVTPEVEVTISRSIVGGPGLKLDLTGDIVKIEEQLQKPNDIVIGVASGATGFTIKNAYLNSYSVNFGVDGLFTEELSYTGEEVITGGSFSPLSDTNLHLPRRQDFDTAGMDGAISASVSVNFNRESQYRLGQYKPFLRTVTFPIECTLQYSLLIPQGGAISATEPPKCAPVATEKLTKVIKACNSSWTIGDARLSSIGWSGGDTGGGNVEVQYTYSSWNNLVIA
jgi:hypothetical protein